MVAIAASANQNPALVGNGPPQINAPFSNPTYTANRFSVQFLTQKGRVYRLKYLTRWLYLIYE